jgi:Zn-dependent protease with chaperone function
MIPMLLSILLTLGLVVPSFQLLEPRSIEEEIGLFPVVLGFGALLIFASGIIRLITAKIGTSRIVARWMDGATPAGLRGEVAIFRSAQNVPPLTLVGICSPRVVISDSAFRLLSGEELRVAVRHELAHVRSRDNLKKFFLRFCAFPGMENLESAWSQSAEFAADYRAVSDQSDAVNLAAALVNLSRLVPAETVPACSIGLVSGSPIRARVARLLAWNEISQNEQARRSYWFAIPFAIASFLFVGMIYGAALNVTHQITEWIVR